MKKVASFVGSAINFFLVLILCQVNLACAVWTKFDLVRTFGKGYGSNGTTPFTKISGIHSGGPITQPMARFGFSIANIGDIDGNGFDDLGVGAIGEDVTYDNELGTQVQAGGIYILFMTSNYTVESYIHINGALNGGPLSYANDNFGYSITSIGDLDLDGCLDIAVGAPSYLSSSVYILYLNKNGTVREYVTVRGAYGDTIPSNITSFENETFIPNGPPIKYGSAFGSALAYMGDMDGDSIPDFCVSNVDRGLGTSFVYILYMYRNGTVKDYTSISSSGGGGGPVIADTDPGSFPRFGISIVKLNDINHDNISDLAIGASSLDDAGSLSKKSGRVYVCLMNANGTVKSFTVISERAGTKMGQSKLNLPSESFDRCGSSLAFMGDINMDNRRAHHPGKEQEFPRPSVGDFIMGCPQTDRSGLTGRLMFIYLTLAGEIAGYTVSLANTDEGFGPDLQPGDQFGASLAVMQDLDKNGLHELAVGAPGDNDNGESSGAVYVMYYRRRQWHPTPFPFLKFILIVTLVPFFCCCMIWSGLAYFFFYFRRKPDPIETIVKQSGLEINPNRKRPKYVFMENVEHADNYTL